jgi:hypothetical protein
MLHLSYSFLFIQLERAETEICFLQGGGKILFSILYCTHVPGTYLFTNPTVQYIYKELRNSFKEKNSVVDPETIRSASFWRIRIRIYFNQM